jgi:hypothetical protein
LDLEKHNVHSRNHNHRGAFFYQAKLPPVGLTRFKPSVSQKV